MSSHLRINAVINGLLSGVIVQAATSTSNAASHHSFHAIGDNESSTSGGFYARGKIENISNLCAHVFQR